MGIYDREYYRREGPSYLGSFIERGRMCKWLIAINIVFFVIQIATQHGPEAIRDPDGKVSVIEGSAPFTDALRLDVDGVFHGQVWRLLSYAFLHQVETNGSLPMHILFNMLFLWWFGTDV